MPPSDPASPVPVASPRLARHFAVMPAAGTGSRVGAAVPKQYLDLVGRPMLARTAEALVAAPWIERVVIVVAPGDSRAEQALAGLPRVTALAEGGATRRDSVLAGLRALVANEGTIASDWVLVHDAARPGVDRDSLERLRSILGDDEVGGLLALPVSDTVKRAAQAQGEALCAASQEPLAATPAQGARVARTLPREGLWLAQTPQMFRVGLLLEALERFADVTDEAAAIERLGRAPHLVEGARDNFKVTTPGDLEAMRRLFGHHRGFGATSLRGSDGEAMSERDDTVTAVGLQPGAPAARAPAGRLRVGQGYDVHALVPGRPLLIGGVRVPYGYGLLGHSDADVLLHAVTDALLGAAALGDIGRHFPDTDPRFSGADSAVLLAEAVRRVRNAGFEILNVDATVIAQAPKLAPHIPGMVAGIAQTLGIDPACVNVKAKTSERLGFAGRGEGIEAAAVVLLSG